MAAAVATILDRRTLMLEAPVVSTIAILAAPNVLNVAVQSLVLIADGWFVGRLGTTELAALALVFPAQTTLQMMSAGAMGGSGAALDGAMSFAWVLFLGCGVHWLGNTLASILRGTGDMHSPGVALIVTAVLQIPLCGVLTLGGLGIGGLGIAGPAASPSRPAEACWRWTCWAGARRAFMAASPAES